MIGRLDNVVLEARDPRALARFYAELLGEGATRLPWSSDDEVAQGLREPGPSGFRVYADPAGHPFCLCWR